MVDRDKVIRGLESLHERLLDAATRDKIAMLDAIIVDDALALLKAQEPITGETSDGYHTFNELYHHRAVLFSVIVSNYKDRAWKSMRHHDGTMYDNMFIVGIDTPDGQVTYDLISRAAALDVLVTSPNFHTTLTRIEELPAVDAVPVVHGRWIEKRWITECDWCVINHRALVCTACSIEIADGEKTPYCPYCGAKMDGDA